MKHLCLLPILSLCLALDARATEYDLPKLAAAEALQVVNRDMNPSDEAVLLSASLGDGLAWINGLEFDEGSIEIEVRGKNTPGRSFVGIAFHGKDDETFDAVYVRPFNFRSELKRDKSLQYISMPEYGWGRLRKDHPGKYESSITPAPTPVDWLKLKLVLEGNQLTVHVNEAKQPALTVELLNRRLNGRVGLWVGNNSDGAFRNLTVVSKDRQGAAAGVR